MVRLVSAMLVASTTLRCPGAAGTSAASCAAPSRSPYERQHQNPASRGFALLQVALHRAGFSAAPGRKHNRSPACSRNAARTAWETCSYRMQVVRGERESVLTCRNCAPVRGHDRRVSQQARKGCQIEGG